MNNDKFLTERKNFARDLGFENLFEFIDNFGIYAGMHTIGNKLFTYELFKQTINVPGDIFEFGVFKGSNLLFLAKLSQLMQPHSPKKIYGFDNFSGLPEDTLEDGQFAKSQIGKYKGNELELRKAISLFSFEKKVELVPGDALKTIPHFFSSNKEKLISFAYIDFDLYQPVKVALEEIEDSLSVGGVIVFDEALTNEWPGETLAMKQFLKSTKMQFSMMSNTLSRQPTCAIKRIA